MKTTTRLATAVASAATIGILASATLTAQVTSSEFRITNSGFRTSMTSTGLTGNQELRFPQYDGTGRVFLTTNTASPFTVTKGTIDLSSNNFVSNVLNITNGGTGGSSFTDGAVLIGNGTSPIQAVSLGANQILRGVGGSSDPTAVDLLGGTGITITNNAGNTTIAVDATALGIPQGFRKATTGGGQDFTFNLAGVDGTFDVTAASKIQVSLEDDDADGIIATVTSFNAGTDAVVVHLSGDAGADAFIHLYIRN